MSMPSLQAGAPLNDNEKLAWLRLIRTENVGPITFYQFVERYGSAGAALDAIPDITRNLKRKLRVPESGTIEAEIEKLHKAGGRFIMACEADYPLALSSIEDAPPVISVLGNADLLKKPSTAIIGARNASLNGQKFAEKLARDLGNAGQIITSGLARGIDTHAHKGGLDTGTIAVVAGGIDVVYPSENQKLYEQICAQGLVIAENPMGTAPRARDFPRRNRIVSGLSQGVVVVEATQKSGSLITARLAGEQGRDVYAIPGHPLDPRASGPNALIRDGATLVRNAEDILENLNNFSGHLFNDGFEDSAQSFYIHNNQHPDNIPENVDTKINAETINEMIDGLSYSAVLIDTLIQTYNIPASIMQITLLELELEGKIQRLPGNQIIKLSE